MDTEQLLFFLELTNWNETNIDIFINFTNPLAISKGSLMDNIILKIINKDLFVAKNSNQKLLSENVFI